MQRDANFFIIIILLYFFPPFLLTLHFPQAVAGSSLLPKAAAPVSGIIFTISFWHLYLLLHKTMSYK